MAIDDQASNLRNLMREERQVRTIAVTSGKGGVGKSNIALNLSILMSAAGYRVALVDADLALANLDVLLDVTVSTNLSHVIAGSKRVEDVLVDLPCGVQLVPGASGLAKMAQLSEFQRVRLLEDLTALEMDNDMIIVDTGAGIGPDVLQFVANADKAIVVTTPEPPAITDAYAVIKVLWKRDYQGQVSLLVNQASDRHEGRATYQRISDVAKKFLSTRVFDAGYMLTDPKVHQAVVARKPLVLAFPRCPASRCLAALANKLSRKDTIIGRKEGFFRRVANWFA